MSITLPSVVRSKTSHAFSGSTGKCLVAGLAELTQHLTEHEKQALLHTVKKAVQSAAGNVDKFKADLEGLIRGGDPLMKKAFQSARATGGGANALALILFWVAQQLAPCPVAQAYWLLGIAAAFTMLSAIINEEKYTAAAAL